MLDVSCRPESPNSRISIHEEAQTSKQLGLGPAMHGRVVPAQKKTSAAKRTIRLLPHGQEVIQDGGEEIVQFLETPLEQHSQVDGLGVVIQFAPVYRQPGAAGEWLR